MSYFFFMKPEFKTYQAIHPRSIVAENEVLRNTYFLLGLTLVFSALTAAFSMMIGARPNGILIDIICMYGLLYLVHRNAHQAAGILFTFAFTGYMGYALGPLLNMVINQFSNGQQLVLLTAGTTGVIFLSVSAYTLISKKSFSYMGGTLLTLLWTGIILSIAGVFLHIPMLILAVNALFILVFSGLIMYHTSEIIHGGETNYILATVSLYLALYNLFIHLLQIFMMFNGGGRRD